MDWLSFKATAWHELPCFPGVYRFYDKEGTLLYVGKAKQLVKRVGSYFQQNNTLNGRTRRMVKQVDYIMCTEVPSEHDALLLENNLIKTHHPKYNIKLRDDKTYPYLCITNEPFPRLLGIQQKNKIAGLYIGPYTSRRAMRYLREELQRMCKLRSCHYDLSAKHIQQKKYKVCLEYHIGNCLGPCAGLQHAADYEKEVQQAIDILKGNTSSVKKYLRTSLVKAANARHFEEAQRLKDKLHALDKLQSRSIVVSPTLGNLDVCTLVLQNDTLYINYMQVVEGCIIMSDTFTTHPPVEETPADVFSQLLVQLRAKYASTHKEVLVNLPVPAWDKHVRLHCPKRGDKKKLVTLSLQNAMSQQGNSHKAAAVPRMEKVLRQVQRELRMQVMPNHIECFDISNLQGAQVVGAMVCFKKGKPAKQAYRYFHVRTLTNSLPNDYAAMQEVIGRHYARLQRENTSLPDLIVVDGGKGQLNIACKVLEELQLTIPIVGLAKRLEEVFLPATQQPLPLSPAGATSRLLQQIRDETHRVALTFHQKTRSREALSSSLTQLPGIGEATRTKLFRRFHTLSAIQHASLEALVDCIGKHRAHILQAAFKQT